MGHGYELTGLDGPEARRFANEAATTTRQIELAQAATKQVLAAVRAVEQTPGPNAFILSTCLPVPRKILPACA